MKRLHSPCLNAWIERINRFLFRFKNKVVPDQSRPAPHADSVAMESLPLCLSLKDKPCLIVGGDEKAVGKILLLLKAKAKVMLSAQELHRDLQELLQAKKITQVSQKFEKHLLKGMRLVVATTTDPKLGQEIYDACQEQGILCNVVDNPKYCDFFFPSIIDRAPLQIAISTGGTSPTLARVIRSRIEAMLPQTYGRLAQMLGSFRETILSTLPSVALRKKFWDQVFSGPILETFLTGKEDEAIQALQKAIKDPNHKAAKSGLVCLVGAGPGDADLLTIKALRLIQSADTIVYDRLINKALLEYARRDVELIYVGKKSAMHVVPQEGINQKLVDLANQGKMVIRLKGGDPFIFGRGGEEIETLRAEGIDFMVVPGVTAAAGCGSYAGIPLTHRDYAQSCMFITGHLKDGSLDLNWKAIAHKHQTLVFYMGLSNLEMLAKKLIEEGLSAQTPAAVVHRGTTREQKVAIGVLADIHQKVLDLRIEPPGLIIVGEVVSLQPKLSWFQA